jgi:hypothetical protein
MTKLYEQGATVKRITRCVLHLDLISYKIKIDTLN